MTWILAGVAEAPLDPLQLVDGGLVHLAVVRQHQPQPGGAVGGADDVLLAPEQGHQNSWAIALIFIFFLL